MVTNSIQFSLKIVYMRKKSTNNKCWRGCEEKGPLSLAGNITGYNHCGRQMKVPQETNNGVAI